MSFKKGSAGLRLEEIAIAMFFHVQFNDFNSIILNFWDSFAGGW